MSPKKKALTLTIPAPCGENFNAMTPVKGGKFCGSCEKTIVDFRTMNDYQILQFYKQNNGKICGVFNNRQLNRAMPFPMEVKPSSNWKAIAALAAGVLFSGGLISQTTAPTIGKVAVATQTINQSPQAEEATTPNKVIRGTIKDQEVGEALFGANILIKGTKIGTSTDFDGHFELVIPDDISAFELEISYLGFDTQTLLFNDKYPIPSHPIDISLDEGHDFMGQMIMGIMIMEEGTFCEAKSVPVEEIVPDVDLLETKGIATDIQMTIFPNPFIDNIQVNYDFEEQGDYLFHLYDNNGRLLFAKTYNLSKGKQAVDLDMAAQHLLDGMYILQISDKQDRILATKKVLKGQA